MANCHMGSYGIRVVKQEHIKVVIFNSTAFVEAMETLDVDIMQRV